MKYILRSLAFSILFALPHYAQVSIPYNEHFIYNLGGIDQQSTEWARYTDFIGSTLDVQVVSGNLTYGIYPMSAQGNRLEMTSNIAAPGEIVYDYLSFQPETFPNTVYAAFLLNFKNLDDLTTDGSYFVGLNDNDYANNKGFLRVWVRRSGPGASTFNFGMTKNSDGEEQIVWTTDVYNISTTYLIVISYKIVEGTRNDIINFWVNPDLSGIEPTPTLTLGPSSPFDDASEISSFFIRETSEMINIYMDALRISSSWIQTTLPVELSSFIGKKIGSSVILEWTTETETNNYGFEIYRKSDNNLFNEWDKIGFVNGNGNSNTKRIYTFYDSDLQADSYKYRLKQIDNNGDYGYSDILEINNKIESEFSLGQNYPNPFNPTTKIQFNIPFDDFVDISLFNPLGQKVETLFNGSISAGIHQINFSGSELNSGVYYYILTCRSIKEIKKMILLK